MTWHLPAPGYQWNKYNSTHYDYDNPPPKVVMGYKFNIFYPGALAHLWYPHLDALIIAFFFKNEDRVSLKFMPQITANNHERDLWDLSARICGKPW